MKSLWTDEAVNQFADMFAMLDPDEVLRQAGLTRKDLIKLTYDDEIGMCMDIRSEALAAVPYKFIGKNADFVSDQLRPWLNHIIESGHKALYYGYSVIENVFRRDGRVFLLNHSLEKPFYWFYPDENGNLFYYNDYGYQSADFHPGLGEKKDTRFKFTVTRAKATYDNPRGVALLSRLYWTQFFKANGDKFWMQFLERSAIPMLVGSGNNTTALGEALALAVQDAVIAVGKDETVANLEVSSTGESFDKAATAMIKRIQKTILGRVLTGDLQKGSYAAQKVEESVADSKLISDIRLVSATVQHICDALTTLNRMEPVQFQMGEFNSLEADRAARDKLLVDAKMLRFTDQYIKREYHLMDWDFIVEGQLESQSQAMSLQLSHQLAEDSKKKFTPDQQDVEDIIDLALEEFQAAIPYAEMLGIIAKSDSEEGLLAALDDAFSQHGATTDVSELAARAIFLGEIVGFVNATTGKGEPPPRPNDPEDAQ